MRCTIDFPLSVWGIVFEGVNTNQWTFHLTLQLRRMLNTWSIPSKTISPIMHVSRNAEKKALWGNKVITKSIPSCHRSPNNVTLPKRIIDQFYAKEMFYWFWIVYNIQRGVVRGQSETSFTEMIYRCGRKIPIINSDTWRSHILHAQGI